MLRSRTRVPSAAPRRSARAPRATVRAVRRRATPAAAVPWRPLARFAVAMLRQDEAAARRELQRARQQRAGRVAAEETALMLVPHAGYPAALEALRVLQAAWPGRARRSREGTPAAWRKRGAATCAAVYGRVYPRLLANLDALHPDMCAWVVEEGYGRMLSRPGLTPLARELVAVAVLAAAGWERQLVSHLRGARHAGAARDELMRALDCGTEGAPATAVRAAARAWSVAFDAAARRDV